MYMYVSGIIHYHFPKTLESPLHFQVFLNLLALNALLARAILPKIRTNK